MDVFEAIHTRRSVSKVQETVPEKAVINKVLEASLWAPNHYLTEPYTFEVLIGEGRDKLGSAYGRINVEALGPDATEEEKREAYDKGLKKARRSPVVIVVKVQPSDRKNVIFAEEIAATACAVQNMLLTAHGLGLGAMWRSGNPAYHPIMKKTFGVTGDGLVLGFIYLGYPVEGFQKIAPRKRPLEDVVQWVDKVE
ncbi:MAG: nitroreductase family protein [Tuberibacillus sp.]